MNRDDIVQFVRRDWSLVARWKARFWFDLKARPSAAEVLSIADQLRQQAQLLRPHWPTPDERLDDLAVHHRVAEALRAVNRRPCCPAVSEESAAVR